MISTVKKLLALCLSCLMSAALAIPAAADAIVSPEETVTSAPVGAIVAALLIAAAVLVTVLLIRYFFKKK